MMVRARNECKYELFDFLTTLLLIFIVFELILYVKSKNYLYLIIKINDIIHYIITRIYIKKVKKEKDY